MELKTLKIDSGLHEKLKSLAETKNTSMQNIVEEKLSEMISHEDDIVFSINKTIFNAENNMYTLEFTEQSYKKLITFFEIFLTNRNLKNVNEIENLLKIISELKNIKLIEEKPDTEEVLKNFMNKFIEHNNSFYQLIKETSEKNNEEDIKPPLNSDIIFRNMLSDVVKKDKEISNKYKEMILDVRDKYEKLLKDAYGEIDTYEKTIEENIEEFKKRKNVDIKIENINSEDIESDQEKEEVEKLTLEEIKKMYEKEIIENDFTENNENEIKDNLEEVYKQLETSPDK